MAKNNTRCVMVCVTPQASCERLIAAGARIAAAEQLPLTVMSVFPARAGLDAANGAVLEHLYERAREHNAAMQVYFNEDPDLVTAVAAAKYGAATIVTGFPAEGSSGFIARVHAMVPQIPITMVDENGKEYRVLAPGKQELTLSALVPPTQPASIG